ncbi:MAG: DUF3341 domain-containing protein [Fuerstiella sp.]
MSTVIEPQSPASPSVAPEPAGLLAAFTSAHDVVAATQKVRDAGYRRIDVHSPFPLHGVDTVLKAKKPLLPFAALIGAAIGLGGGIWMAWWMNAIDYPFIISGKPLFSILPSLPVAFELAILLAAFAVFGGALALGGLPKHSNRLFSIPVFARATNDRFFLSIEASDSRFDADELSNLLNQAGAVSIDHIPHAEPGSPKIPRPFAMAAAALLVLALVPPVLIAKARSTTSTTPRLSFISDMDYQPKFKAQTVNRLFADGRAMRPQVSGTIARGDLRSDVALYRGIVAQEIRSADGGSAVGLREPEAPETPPSQPLSTSTGDLQTTVLVPDQADRANDRMQTSPADGSSETVQAWVTRIPVDVDESFIRRGRQRYDIYCATCHGIGGDGDGLVTLRALELEQGTWVKPTSLHAEPVRMQPDGQLYNTISNGIRKMPGYASQIPVEDRWAIVAYLRALQKTRTAGVDDVPSDVLPNIRELN